MLFTNLAPVAAITNAVRISTGTFDTNSTNNYASVIMLVDHDGDGIPTSLEITSPDANHNGIAAYLDAFDTFNLSALVAGMTNTLASFSGAVYQLQYTTNLQPTATWIDLGGAVTAQSTALSITDTNVAPSRAYRVRLQKLP